jgi:hypothetical protein
MTAAYLFAAYARIAALYHRQLDLLVVDEPDLDALAALAAEIDAELGRLPTSDRLPALGRDESDRLAAAAREADALRARAAARLAALRDASHAEAAGAERAASALRAYAPAADPGAARFLDQRL